MASQEDADAKDLQETSPEEEAARLAGLEEGRLLFAKECKFLLGVVNMAGLPPADYPEVAFAGRSNVGKSSLLNALTGRKNLARTSDTPGRTQEINYFLLGERLMLVDLPGYGYAKVSRTKSTAWTRLKKSYLRGRVNLRRACVLIDARRGMLDSDLSILDMLDEAAVIYQIVLTKCDKLKNEELEKRKAKIAHAISRRPAAHPLIIETSARKGTGIPELRAALTELAASD